MINTIKLVYSDIAVGAKENFNYHLSSRELFTPEDILGLEEHEIKNYAIMGELNQTFLDGVQEIFREDKSNLDIGVWSELQADENGDFSEHIILRLKSDVGNFTSQGFTMLFDEYLDTYPKNTEVRWYRDDELLDTKQFVVNSSQYFFDNLVRNYNEVQFEFSNMNYPYARLKINKIDFGLVRTYTNDELSAGMQINNEMSAISNEICINTMDFKLITKTSGKLLFQSKQPLELYINDIFKGIYFVREGNQVASDKYEVKAEDYIGIMASSYFKGGIYNNKSTEDLIDEIFASCNVPYEIVDEIPIQTLSGYIGYTTSREALQQVLFACGMVCDTSDSDKVIIFNVGTDVSGIYTEADIMQGQKSKTDKVLTEVRLTEHFYKPITNQTTIYDVATAGLCEDKLIIFSKPLHDLTITGGEITESGSNYAIVTFTEDDGILVGQEYEETTSEYVVTNPDTNFGDLENSIKVNTATLISQNNASLIANKIFDYYLDRDKVTAKIAGLENRIGDKIEMSNTFMEDKYGIIEKINYNAGGGYVPEVEIR